MNRRIRAKRLKLIMYGLNTVQILYLKSIVNSTTDMFLGSLTDVTNEVYVKRQLAILKSLSVTIEALYQLNADCMFKQFENCNGDTFQKRKKRKK